MLKFKFLGLLTIAILLISFLNCTTAINPDNKLDPKTDALLKHIMSLGDCSEFEATYILRIIVEQRGNDWDYDFLGRYVDVLAGDWEAKEELDTNIWFQAFVDAFDDDIKAWKHKSLEEKAAALNIKDIVNQDEFDAFIENCTIEEQLYSYNRLNSSINSIELIANETEKLGDFDVEGYKAAEKRSNNAMTLMFSTASKAKTEYEIMSNSSTSVDWDNPLKLIENILNSGDSKGSMIYNLKSLNKSYADKYTNLSNTVDHLNSTSNMIRDAGVILTTLGIGFGITGSALILLSIVKGDILGLIVSSILVAVGIIFGGIGGRLVVSSNAFCNSVDSFGVMTHEFTNHVKLVSKEIDKAVLSLSD